MITRAKISAVRTSGVQRLFEGGAHYLFCPRCGAYSRAALIRVNTVLLNLMVHYGALTCHLHLTDVKTSEPELWLIFI